ncbi:hypothetical protein HDK90DRAFT_471039 [Phyllosticta capitalensis]|uniref:Uncharacterized protein n=1 Tax=Phyllosticta capitalensis TaxID=121624 RepID=A0ABR1YA09_9PEZI
MAATNDMLPYQPNEGTIGLDKPKRPTAADQESTIARSADHTSRSFHGGTEHDRVMAAPEAFGSNTAWWFYEQNEFPSMRSSPDQELKPRHLPAWRAIKASLKRKISGHASDDKSKPGFLEKLRFFLRSRFVKHNRKTPEAVAQDISAESLRQPRYGMELDRTVDVGSEDG